MLLIFSVLLALPLVASQVPTASISSHVLDISGGHPAAGVQILAYVQQDDSWLKIGEEFTQPSGRVDWVSPNYTLVPAVYRLIFLTKPYYESRGVSTFYPYIEIIFEIKDATQHYHVPLTLSPWGYSTYRGS
ncbi:unnamed protein product [Caenorhabditis auriculariae]|uniref:5-hydroxyisourate hydrolase n=1 Tax=Caenorhabditis auriculariae TaxID=2777116 RepID=A0A8S1HRT8_9PELO|nr:unnamed protein product [Caenorhabditis auriculariae]